MNQINKMKIASIVGARPQFIKLAPLVKAIESPIETGLKKEINHLIIHTGQHYDYQMNKIFFDELGLPKPDYDLRVGSGPHGWQIGEMMRKSEEILFKENPSLVLVYGDTNSTLAGALSSCKLGIPVAHVESGLRSYNKEMPEEINRILTDHCADILFCPTENAVSNLKKEGFTQILNQGRLIPSDFFHSSTKKYSCPLIINTGDIMYDTVLLGLKIAEKKSDVLRRFKLEKRKYFLATIHRAENADNPQNLSSIMEALLGICQKIPVIFPVHPRTKKKMERLPQFSTYIKHIQIINPVSYFDMLVLEKNAQKILTDSGGIQKEAYFFKVPCITLREETEWVETLEGGYNILVGTNKEKIIHSALSHSSKHSQSSPISVFGIGNSASVIINVIHSRLSGH